MNSTVHDKRTEAEDVRLCVRLGQYVSDLVLAGEVYEEDVIFVVSLSDVVKIYVRVLRAVVGVAVLGEMNARGVVHEDACGGCLRYPQLAEETTEVYNARCCLRGRNVLCLRRRQCDHRL
jgi:hypothetical protein